MSVLPFRPVLEVLDIHGPQRMKPMDFFSATMRPLYFNEISDLSGKVL